MNCLSQEDQEGEKKTGGGGTNGDEKRRKRRRKNANKSRKTGRRQIHSMYMGGKMAMTQIIKEKNGCPCIWRENNKEMKVMFSY